MATRMQDVEADAINLVTTLNLSDGEQHLLTVTGDKPVHVFEGGAAAPDNAFDGHVVYPVHPDYAQEFYFTADAGAAMWCWAPRGDSRIAVSEV